MQRQFILPQPSYDEDLIWPDREYTDLLNTYFYKLERKQPNAQELKSLNEFICEHPSYEERKTQDIQEKRDELKYLDLLNVYCTKVCDEKDPSQEWTTFNEFVSQHPLYEAKRDQDVQKKLIELKYFKFRNCYFDKLICGDDSSQEWEHLVQFLSENPSYEQRKKMDFERQMQDLNLNYSIAARNTGGGVSGQWWIDTMWAQIKRFTTRHPEFAKGCPSKKHVIYGW